MSSFQCCGLIAGFFILLLCFTANGGYRNCRKGNGGSKAAEHPAGVQDAEPPLGGLRAKPPEAEALRML